MKRGGFRKDYEVSNRFEIVHAGKLPEDKERLLGEIDHALSWDESRFRLYFVGRQ
jgi:hypothetical protein